MISSNYIQVRIAPIAIAFYVNTYLQHVLYWIQAMVEAKDTQLQQKDTQLQHKDGQIQRQATELRERTLQLNRQRRLQAEVEAKDAEIARQQRELQALRVRTYCCKVWFCSSSSSSSSIPARVLKWINCMHSCSGHSWWVNCPTSSNRPRRKMLKPTDNRENYKHWE